MKLVLELKSFDEISLVLDGLSNLKRALQQRIQRSGKHQTPEEKVAFWGKKQDRVTHLIRAIAEQKHALARQAEDTL